MLCDSAILTIKVHYKNKLIKYCPFDLLKILRFLLSMIFDSSPTLSQKITPDIFSIHKDFPSVFMWKRKLSFIYPSYPFKIKQKKSPLAFSVTRQLSLLLNTDSCRKILRGHLFCCLKVLFA